MLFSAVISEHFSKNRMIISVVAAKYGISKMRDFYWATLYICSTNCRVKYNANVAKYHLYFLCVDTYDMKSEELRWADDNPIELPAKKLNLPQFALENHYHQYCTERYKTGNIFDSHIQRRSFLHFFLDFSCSVNSLTKMH